MTCPGCNGTLVAETFGGVQLDVCATCGGVWFDEGELRNLIKLGPTALEAASTASSGAITNISHKGRICPKCNSALESYHYAYSSPFVIDGCATCGGVFVDQGEVAGIREFSEQAAELTPQGEAALAISMLEHETGRMKERARRIAQFVGFRRMSSSSAWWELSDDPFR